LYDAEHPASSETESGEDIRLNESKIGELKVALIELRRSFSIDPAIREHVDDQKLEAEKIQEDLEGLDDDESEKQRLETELEKCNSDIAAHENVIKEGEAKVTSEYDIRNIHLMKERRAANKDDKLTDIGLFSTKAPSPMRIQLNLRNSQLRRYLQ